MKIYNSLTRKKELFKPIKKGRVGIYVCGPTVYDEPHIGHARAAYIFEVIRGYIEYKGYKVKFVKNITDVDDKIIAKAKEELPNLKIKEAVKKIAAKYTKRYYEDMDVLGIRRATHAPCATGHIKDMIEFISRLLKKKYAYESEGSVYFDVRRFKGYGGLSHQNLNQMRSAVRIEKDEKKRDALDFALWKKAKEGEPSWTSPWGEGRPGWHIECSVMSSKYLGEEFDIHGGGRDLIFPHHENEIAQSRACNGGKFARIWMHNGLLTINQQKMAKSLGNFISVKEFLKKNSPPVLKFFFLSALYRKPIDFSQERIHEAKKTCEKFEIFSTNLKRKVIQGNKKTKIRAPAEILNFKKRFEEAMDDDFNIPEALAALFDLVNYGNKLLVDCRSEHGGILLSVQNLFHDCLEIFGLSFKKVDKKKISSKKIEIFIKKRNKLRKNGNFAEADRIRKGLQSKGVILEDRKEGTIWRKGV